MATDPTPGAQRQKIGRGSCVLAELPVQSTLVKSNAVGSRCAPSRLVLGVQMKTLKEARGLILIEIFESLGSRIVALIYVP